MDKRGTEPGLTRFTRKYRNFAAKPQPNRRMIGKTMTAPRHQRKRASHRPGAGILAAVVAIAWLAGAPAMRAATTEYIVLDRNSGLAISGFDPVAYFIDGSAALGRGEFEYAFAGAVWRFRNEGNRGAFIADPATYMPRFGGYDPTAVARGVAVPGNPRLWTISGKQLFLFSTPQARDLFIADAGQLTATADRKWPSVKLTLSP
jgi:hypothetical protein